VREEQRPETRSSLFFELRPSEQFTLVALGAARQHAFEQLGLDPARDGMSDMHRWRLYASSEVHHTVFRAAGILGIGRRNVSLIPVDAEMRIRDQGSRSTDCLEKSDGRRAQPRNHLGQG
jgi:hypothetical protein